MGNSLLNISNGTKKGASILVIPDNMKPEGSDNFFQYAAIVFGMISDKNKTAKVRIIDATVRLSSPHIRDTSAPTPTAPIVCAIVFKVKIAVRGLTESSSFNRDHRTPFCLVLH